MRYCENSHLSKRQKQAQGIVDDEDYMNAMHHAVDIGPLETGLSACEIIAEEHPDSPAYEQLLIGLFGSLLNSLAKCEPAKTRSLSTRIVQSNALNELAFEFYTAYLNKDAEVLLKGLRLQIAKRRKWKHKLRRIQ